MLTAETRDAVRAATLRPRADELYDAYLFDLDGTIYLGDQLLPGAADLLAELRRRSLPVRFVSNNPTRSPEAYVTKLRGLGLEAELEEVTNTVVAMVRWLEREHPDAVVFPIAERPLVDALLAAGFEVSDDASRVDVVIASYDRTLTYAKLQVAFDALWMHQRAILVTTNPDPYCPLPGGRGEPDAAAVVAAIEASTGVTLTKNVGKPDAAMVHAALAGLDVSLSRCVMVGDRLPTDIRMATDVGMASAMVLTGDSTRAEAEALPAELQPDLLLERVDHLLPGAVTR
ncbi:HAD-superfamily hydrolase, subfamily IIA [Beutenbergia cavernae DSM 12333]|uniref:HAD-superfamily hydrolase, subfamily IIA n=1 Tax=Beutenbergia cavernae (strain ATCC BAA-8 / DSM 12333 / CCUG 43141 / JCM 11478 / NBRC 16432 / NCIMB 13614 / HKI 0122) TaxID=471853 RepID=C5C361_BEUC1|nr:HAD-IIA family hydrolase [Beutenbergia cavernae]ACQ79760.1 HAD-superfamily hydrolase, subfamily IIA [Beutenbergia cavernae DSM 12333]